MPFPDWEVGDLLTADELNIRNPLLMYKPTQESRASTTTLQDDADLVFSLAENAVYTMDSYLIYTGALDGGTGAGGLKLQFTGPSGATMTWTNFGANTSGGVTQYNVVAEALTAGSPRSVPSNAGTPMSCQPKGVIFTAGTAGDLHLRWAQNTSNATATVLLAGSWMRLTRIA